MTGIIDRLMSLAGADTTKVVDFAHTNFSSRMGVHGHTGRAVIETVVELCRAHPNLVGIAAGVLVERLLVAEKIHHEEHVQAAADAAGGTAIAVEAPAESKAIKVAKARRGKSRIVDDTHHLRLHALKPGRVAFEVFGGLLLLKMAASGARIFRHKHQGEVWFAPAAKIHLFSATICAYNLVKAFRSSKVSAWRNGAVLFFGTDAIKPVLKWYRTHPAHEWQAVPVPAPVAEVAAEPKPDPAFVRPEAPAAVVGFGLPPQDYVDRAGQQAVF